MIIEEGNLKFNFSFDVIKFDETIYYRNHFIKIQSGLKAIDILGIENNKNYMIEVKDYTHPDTKSMSEVELIEDLIKKILDSLSSIYSMSLYANDVGEKEMAIKFLANKELSLIFHIEIPPPRRGLKQALYNLSNMQLKLRNKLKSITNKTNIKVVSINNLSGLSWSVST